MLAWRKRWKGFVAVSAPASVWNPWAICKRLFSSRDRRKLRLKMLSYDLMMSKEKHVRQAMYLKELMIQRPGHTINMQELRDECDKTGIKCRNLYYLLEFYKTIFDTRVDRRRMEWVEFGEDGRRLVELEMRLLEEYEPVLVENLRKLLMMSATESISLKKIAASREYLGLPFDFEQNLVHKYPQYFEVVISRDKVFSESAPFLKLTAWDPLLAVPRREADAEESNRDPFSFRLKFPATKRMTRRDQLFLEQFQKLSFPSPYDPGHGFPSHSREAVKRAVAVVHEFLCLTQEKRAYVECLRLIRRETGLPRNVEDMLERYPGIFYVSGKSSIPRFPARDMVYLKEAYRKPADDDPVQCTKLVDKGPLVRLKDAFALTMYLSDKAYDKVHGTDSFKTGRPYPAIPYDAFLCTFQSDKYREQKEKYEGIEYFC